MIPIVQDCLQCHHFNLKLTLTTDSKTSISMNNPCSVLRQIVESDSDRFSTTFIYGQKVSKRNNCVLVGKDHQLSDDTALQCVTSSVI